MLPLVPPGTMAAFAVMAPVSTFRVDTTGFDCPVGHVVMYPSGPVGTAVKFSVYACALDGTLHEPAWIGNVRLCPADSAGPDSAPEEPRVSTTRQARRVGSAPALRRFPMGQNIRRYPESRRCHCSHRRLFRLLPRWHDRGVRLDPAVEGIQGRNDRLRLTCRPYGYIAEESFRHHRNIDRVGNCRRRNEAGAFRDHKAPGGAARNRWTSKGASRIARIGDTAGRNRDETKSHHVRIGEERDIARRAPNCERGLHIARRQTRRNAEYHFVYSGPRWRQVSCIRSNDLPPERYCHWTSRVGERIRRSGRTSRWLRCHGAESKSVYLEVFVPEGPVLRSLPEFHPRE